MNHPAPRRFLLVVGMLLVAINLRSALASVGPLVGPIMERTGISAPAFGMLTTLPLVAFAAFSLFAPAVTRRLGLGGALALALLLITVGTGLRPLAGAGVLFLGTAILGTGIALGNVLLPALVKRDFSHRSGSMTSLYSSVMGIGATVAAGISVPVAQVIGWRGALMVWAAPAAIALGFWLWQVRGRPRTAPVADTGAGTLRVVARSPLAWQVALFLGLQSFTFYVILAWLPDMLQSGGTDAATAGWLLALSQATGIAGSALVPFVAARRADQTSVVLGLGAIELVALFGLFANASGWATALWVGLLGFAMGGMFSLALLFLVLRAPDTRTATSLSGMVQSVGYLVAAVGPTLIGWVYGVTSTWSVPLLCLFATLAMKMAAGAGAARDRQVRQ